MQCFVKIIDYVNVDPEMYEYSYRYNYKSYFIFSSMSSERERKIFGKNLNPMNW